MSTCQRCQQTFTCAMADNTGQPCWCISLPTVPIPLKTNGKIDMNALCFCPQCLPIWASEITQKSGSNQE